VLRCIFNFLEKVLVGISLLADLHIPVRVDGQVHRERIGQLSRLFRFIRKIDRGGSNPLQKRVRIQLRASEGSRRGWGFWPALTERPASERLHHDLSGSLFDSFDRVAYRCIEARSCFFSHRAWSRHLTEEETERKESSDGPAWQRRAGIEQARAWNKGMEQVLTRDSHTLIVLDYRWST
jgi:hypothetical protein